MTRLLPLLLALVAAPAALAQRPAAPSGGGASAAPEAFHEAVRLYVAGQTAEAQAAVEAGLRARPGDPHLQALAVRLRRPPPPPQGGGGEQPPPPDPPDAPPDEPQDGQGDGPQDEPPRDDRPGAEADQTRAEPDTPNPPDETDDGRRDPRDEAPQPGDAGAPDDRLSREEAQRILDAIGAEEESLLRTIPRRPVRPRRVEKDW